MKDIKKFLFVSEFFLVALFLLSRAETVFCQPDADCSLVFPQRIETKHFYFLSLLRHLNEAENILLNDNELQSVAMRKQTSFVSASTHQEIIQAMHFSESERVNCTCMATATERASSGNTGTPAII